jgi:hypothetical protein
VADPDYVDPTGEKIQFSTLEIADGAITKVGGTGTISGWHHVEIPYTDGMFVSTLWGNESGNYCAMVVKNPDGSYTKPIYTVGTEEISTNSTLNKNCTATLTGFESGSVVYVNFSIKNVTTEVMDNSGYLYYIPGGEI